MDLPSIVSKQALRGEKKTPAFLPFRSYRFLVDPQRAYTCAYVATPSFFTPDQPFARTGSMGISCMRGSETAAALLLMNGVAAYGEIMNV